MDRSREVEQLAAAWLAGMKAGDAAAVASLFAEGEATTVIGNGADQWFTGDAYTGKRLAESLAEHGGIPFEPGSPWHDAILACWLPRYGDRTNLVDLTTINRKSRSLEDRVYRRWQPRHPFYVRPPIMIAIPARGKVATVSFADVIRDPARLDRRFNEVARLTFDDP